MGWRNKNSNEFTPGEQLYDSYDPQNRNPVDLEDLELLDEDGKEIDVYDEQGYRVPRRIPKHHRAAPSCGILADLTRIRSFFRHTTNTLDDNDDAEEEILHKEEPLKLYVYPQALTRQYGYFQANSAPTDFKLVLKKINSELAENADVLQPVLRIVSCQGYNHIQHSLTHRSGGLELVHGNITSTLAGSYASHDTTKKKFQKLLQSTATHRPHERVEKKLQKEEPISRGFRVEPICIIDVMALKVEHRSGRSVSFSFIIIAGLTTQ